MDRLRGNLIRPPVSAFALRPEVLPSSAMKHGATIRSLRGMCSAVLGGLAALAALTATGRAGEGQGPVFTVTLENDLFVNTDRHYTQGLKFTYMLGDDQVQDFPTNWLGRFPSFGFEPTHTKSGMSVGQSIFTPSDTSITALIPNDRPYAGWLYLGMILQRRGTNEFLSRYVGNHSLVENLEVSLGVVGPWALGGEAQTWVHEIRSFDLPQGWHNQLRNEPAVQIRYTRLWVYRTPRSWEPLSVDFIPHYGANLGTVHVFGNVGATLRIGLNVPRDFGTTTIDAPTIEAGVEGRSKWGFYGFAGLDGRAVAWNTFLDGNIFRSSHHVDKENLVGDFKIGAALVLKRVELGYTYVMRSKEYSVQQQRDAFGSLSMKIKF
jgi:lipid A 3-O-deacylase